MRKRDLTCDYRQLNFGRALGQLQEPNDSLIVLDGKDLIVPCNELPSKQRYFNAIRVTQRLHFS